MGILAFLWIPISKYRRCGLTIEITTHVVWRKKQRKSKEILVVGRSWTNEFMCTVIIINSRADSYSIHTFTGSICIHYSIATVTYVTWINFIISISINIKFTNWTIADARWKIKEICTQQFTIYWLIHYNTWNYML